MEHLWEMNSGMVEDPVNYIYRYENWGQFILDKIWNSNQIYGCIPAYWIWFDCKDQEYQDFGFEQDELTLVYLSLAPCDARVVRINVDKNDEKEIKAWLEQHNFLNLGG